MDYVSSIHESIVNASNFIKKDEDGIYFYETNDGRKIEYKKPYNKRWKDFKNESFKTNEKIHLSAHLEKYISIIQDI